MNTLINTTVSITYAVANPLREETVTFSNATSAHAFILASINANLIICVNRVEGPGVDAYNDASRNYWANMNNDR